MAREIPAGLTHDLISVAETLARQPGKAAFRQACMWRAVSSAYYAVFHALSYICADQLVGWSRTEILPPIYRSLDHTALRRRLSEAKGRPIAFSIAEIGSLFEQLQEERHKADYSPPMALFNQTQCLGLINDARRAVALIEGLDDEARLRLSVLLIARQRT